MNPGKEDYDHNLYSRQEITYGAETMRKLVKLKVMLVGVTGVGLEVAKNLVLAGPNRVTLVDPRVSHPDDRTWNFYLTSDKLASGTTRANSVLKELVEMNSNVKVEVLPVSSFEETVSAAVVGEFDAIVVCELMPFDFMHRLSNTIRGCGKKLVVAVGMGLAGFVFNDFGPSHAVNDPNGEQEKSSIISSISEDGLVTVHEDKRHEFEVGDHVRLREIVGMEPLNGHVLVIKDVPSPFAFRLEGVCPQKHGVYVRNGIAEEVKTAKEHCFEPFPQALELQELPDCDMDFEEPMRTSGLRLLLARIWPLLTANPAGDARPNLFDTSVFDQVSQALSEELAKLEDKEKSASLTAFFQKDLSRFFVGLARAELSPVSSFIGGIAAQEVVKVTGKYTPIKQLFIHEFYSTVLKGRKWAEVERNGSGQAAVIGSAAQAFLNQARVFMVGAGALGCELLKMCALMEVSTQGQFTCTDDDSIEVSNLNRQFLFRREHVGGSKSETAVAAARVMNPNFAVEAIKQRVAQNTENVFTDTFWDQLSFVVNAVDNIQAREYVDQKCVFHEKKLLDSGTLGTKCNSQVILPGATEAYSDSKDPPEKNIPMCTLRSFPSQIEHVIEWARAQFNGLFVDPSKFFTEFAADPSAKLAEYLKDLPYNPVRYRELSENFEYYLDLFRNPTPEGFVKFARDFYQLHFDDAISQLITLFPADYVDKQGRHFWTFPKRPPTPLPFGREQVPFILVAVHVIAQVVRPNFALPQTPEDVIAILEKLPKPVKHEINIEDREKLTSEKKQESSADLSTIEARLREFATLLPQLAGKATIQEVEFEKDDDRNGHIDFITGISNFRATNYLIPCAERYIVKSIAGRIIPAVATATAAVVGVVGIEIYKIALNATFEQHRNFFSNLALNIYNFSEPLPPVIQKDKEYDEIVLGPVKVIPPKSGTWSRTQVKGPMTVAQLKDHIKQLLGINVSGIMARKKNFWNIYDPAVAARESKTIEEIAEEEGVGRQTGQKYFQLHLSAETDDGVDVITPYLKYELGN